MLDEEELHAIGRAARHQRMSTAAWVRQALRKAQPSGDARRKLAVVQAAVVHGFPTGDIDNVLGEIEGGYVDQGKS